jgi:DNA-binding response OmpR family regulator
MADKIYTLLVVDDDIEALEMVRIMLRSTSFSIITANNGEEALAKAQSREVDIVLLDIMMPDISGVTVCGHLRANPRMSKVPIVMLTALDDYATRRKAMQAGATDLITKPVTREELLAKLNGVIAEHYAGTQTVWRG